MAELRALAEALGPALVPPERVDAMAPAVALLGAGEPEFALESHFDQERPRVDLTLRLQPAGRDALLRDAPGRSGPVWELLRAWARPEDPLSASPFIEFEFDLLGEDGADGEYGGDAQPWIGPCVDPLLRAGPRAIQERRDSESGGRPQLSLLLLAASEGLGPARGLSAATRERLRTCVLALPRWGLLGQLARLDGRPSSAREGIRVFVSLPRASFADYFDALGAGGMVEALQIQIERFAPYESWIDLDFGIHHGEIEPRIGFYRESRGPRWVDSRLRRVLARIRADGLCTEAAAEGIRRWVMQVDGRQDRLLTFKVVLGPAGPIRAKVYSSVLRPMRGHGKTPA